MKQATVCIAYVAEVKTASEVLWFLDDPCIETMAGRHHPLKMLCLSICVKLPCSIETVETANDSARQRLALQ